MNRRLCLVLIPPMALAACSSQEPANVQLDEALVAQRSAPLAQAFSTELQGELAAAMGEGGALQAVEICHDAAPRIAADHSAQSGADIRRISDRNRNPQGSVSADAAPYYAELQAQPMADGQPAKRIWASGEGEDAQVHFLAAIPTREQPCLACHGSEIDPELQARIGELYPDDLATGFAAGELRGALMISWPAEEFGL